MALVLAVCFALCGAAFLCLTALSFERRHDPTLGLRVSGACLLQALWAAGIVVNGNVMPVPAAALLASDLARGIGWITVLAVAIVARKEVFRRTLSMALLAAIALIALIAIIDQRLASILQFEAQRWSGLAIAIAGLVVVEQIARNLRIEARWYLKPIILGVGLLFAVELILWSFALLIGRINGELWLVRAIVNLLVAGLIWIGLRRLKGSTLPLMRNERVYFFNTTLAMTGGYVLLMSAASWWLAAGRQISVPVVAAVFSAAAFVLLGVAVFSDQFRAWFRVTLSKLFLRYRYDYRGEWLKLTAALAEDCDSPVHERIVHVMGSFVNSPTGALWIRDEDGFRHACGNLPRPSPFTVTLEPFFQELGAAGWIHDLRAECDTPARGRDRRIAAPTPAWLLERDDVWLVVPFATGQRLVSFLLIGRPLTPTSLGWEQLDLLRVASRQVTAHLELERTAARLAELHQFEALNRLAAFVMHDLRHLVAQLDLVVKNAARHRHNPEFIDDAMLTIESSVQRMTALMETLRHGSSQEQDRRVDLGAVLQEIVSRCNRRSPVPTLENVPLDCHVMAPHDRLQQAIEHLVRNAQDATPATGSITIRVRRTSQQLIVDIDDTGAGMESEFVRTRLFRPFDSTKGDLGMGLGAYEARDIIRKLGGDISVDTAPGAGCRVHVALPAAPMFNA